MGVFVKRNLAGGSKFAGSGTYFSGLHLTARRFFAILKVVWCIWIVRFPRRGTCAGWRRLHSLPHRTRWYADQAIRQILTKPADSGRI